MTPPKPAASVAATSAPVAPLAAMKPPVAPSTPTIRPITPKTMSIMLMILMYFWELLMDKSSFFSGSLQPSLRGL